MARKNFSENAPKFSEREPTGNEPTPAQERVIPTTCIEHQAGRQTERLSFQIKVF